MKSINEFTEEKIATVNNDSIMKTLYVFIYKTFTLSLFLISFSGEAAAHNKVVVIPMAGDTAFQVRPGQVLTGQITHRFPANISFFLVGGSYAAPLPPGTPRPTLVYTTSTTAECPGIGTASSGYLCVYEYLSANVSSFLYSGASLDENRLYGFSLDVFPTNNSSSGFLIASWAYKVP